MTFVLAAYRGNISYISFHKIHIRPLCGGRPRTDVRVASRNIRADAEGGGSEAANAGNRRTEGHKDIRPLRGCGHGLTSAWPEGT